MQCTICNHNAKLEFKGQLLKRYSVSYFLCAGCGHLQTEKPYWLEEAYSDAIASADTGLVQRNVYMSRRLSVLLYLIFGKKGLYVDFAGGTGLLVRMMRDIGFDFFWKDPFCCNVHARGFEFEASMIHCDAVTAIEVLEHLENPVSFIENAIKQAGANTFVFTTELFEGKPPTLDSWWYYSLETGQHISFYQHTTLQYIADQLGLNYYSSSGIHMMTKIRFSRSIFSLAVGRASMFAFPLIQRSVKSKTMDDHRRNLSGEI